MSIQKETIPVPATTREVTVSVTCDLCGKVFRGIYPGDERVEWSGSYVEIETTGVFCTTGWGHQDGGAKTTRAYHICLDCFQTKLEPWLAAQGAKPTEEETDW